MLLSVIARPSNAFEAMRHLLEDNHEPRRQQLRHPPGDRDLPVPAGRRDRGEARQAGRRGPHRPAHGRSPAGLRAEPAAVHVRPRRVRTARSRVAVLRARHGLRGRVHPGRPAADPRRPAEQGARRGRGRDEGGRRRVRGAHGAPPGHHLPEAAGGAALPRVQHLPQEPPVGRRPPAVAEVGDPGHVRAGAVLHGAGVLLRAGPYRGHRAALPRQRLQDPGPQHPGRPEVRGPAGPDRVAGRDGAPGGLQPAGRVGSSSPTRRR